MKIGDNMLVNFENDDLGQDRKVWGQLMADLKKVSVVIPKDADVIGFSNQDDMSRRLGDNDWKDSDWN